MVWLPAGEKKFDDVCQMDGQTSCGIIVRAMHTHRAVKVV